MVRRSRRGRAVRHTLLVVALAASLLRPRTASADQVITPQMLWVLAGFLALEAATVVATGVNGVQTLRDERSAKGWVVTGVVGGGVNVVVGGALLADAAVDPTGEKSVLRGLFFTAFGGVAIGLAVAGGRAGGDAAPTSTTAAALAPAPGALWLRAPALTF